MRTADVRPGSSGSSMRVRHLRAACARDAGAARTFYHQYVRSPQAKPHALTDRARFCKAAGPKRPKGAERLSACYLTCLGLQLRPPAEASEIASTAVLPRTAYGPYLPERLHNASFAGGSALCRDQRRVE